MQCTPVEIKEKLLKALDKDNNVVDMAGVLAVITVLESYPITKEALEQTRIGKYVNELRKKTTNEQLSKRAKKLVRNWQKLIEPDNTAVNGDDHGERVVNKNSQIALLQGSKNSSCPNSPAVAHKLVSPALKANVQNACVNRSSPSSTKSAIQAGRPTTPSMPSGRPTTPSALRSSKPNTPKLQVGAVGLPKSKPYTPTLPSSQQSRTKTQPNTPNLPQYSKLSSPVVNSPKLHSTPKQVNSPKVHINSICASPVVSPDVCLSRPTTPADCIGHGSRPHTPLSNTPSGHLPRNLSHENLSSSSMHSHASVEDGQNETRCNHSNEISPIIKTASPSKPVKPDQSLNVKTNVANKKRSREDLESKSNRSNKYTKVQNNGHGSGYKHVLNGSTQCGSNDNNSCDVVQGWNGAGTLDNKQSLSSKRNAHLPIKTEKHTPVLERSSSLTSKTPKVKTTAQLIADLQAKSGSSVVGSNVIRQIESNQISKEHDEQESVLPPGVGKKKRKNKTSDVLPDMSTPRRSHVSLSQTKTELVEKFLQTSVPPSAEEELAPYKYEESILDKRESPGKENSSMEVDVTDSSHGDMTFRPSEVNTHAVNDDSGGAPPPSTITTEKPLTLEEIYEKLPPIDYANIIPNEDCEEDNNMSEVVEVSESALYRLHNEEWEGVNGNNNINNVWCDWTQTLSSETSDGHPLHILPYVLTDD